MTGSYLKFGIFQVENFSGEVFQVDTKDMKKKLMSEWGIFSSQGGESFQVCGRIYAPVTFIRYCSDKLV